jgi:hypothetical protein
VARDRGGRNLERARIAHLAARLMAEDGIEDYALAKRKAARAAGVPDTRALPDNDEIDAALAAYRAIYEGGEHSERVHRLREIALEAMRALAGFNPHLTGAVLKGTAGKFAPIQLQLFTDRGKALEPHLMDLRIAYRTGATRLYAGDREREVPVYTLERDGVEIQVALLEANDQRAALCTHPGGKPLERADAAAVTALLEAGAIS